jgi:hypothetical protein
VDPGKDRKQADPTTQFHRFSMRVLALFREFARKTAQRDHDIEERDNRQNTDQEGQVIIAVELEINQVHGSSAPAPTWLSFALSTPSNARLAIATLFAARSKRV